MNRQLITYKPDFGVQKIPTSSKYLKNIYLHIISRKRIYEKKSL